MGGMCTLFIDESMDDNREKTIMARKERNSYIL